MTAAQKAAKANFKKAIEYRKKTGVSLKEAFAHVYGKKVGAAPKKKAAKKAAPKKAVKKKVGALPVGFKGSIFDVSFKIVNQYDIYNDVSAIVEDVENGSTIVVYDGKGNANDKAQQFVSYIERKSRNKYSEKDIQSIKPRLVKFSNLMQKEVKEFNSGKKKTIKKQPLVITAPKKVVKKSAPKKAAVKKIARKKHTKYGKVKAHVRRVAGVHKDTKSHNVNIRVVSGISNTKKLQNQEIIKKYNDTINEIAKQEKYLENWYFALKSNKGFPANIQIIKKRISEIKKLISELKTHSKQLKKYF
jgi:hypothetical protein